MDSIEPVIKFIATGTPPAVNETFFKLLGPYGPLPGLQVCLQAPLSLTRDVRGFQPCRMKDPCMANIDAPRWCLWCRKPALSCSGMRYVSTALALSASSSACCIELASDVSTPWRLRKGAIERQAL